MATYPDEMVDVRKKNTSALTLEVEKRSFETQTAKLQRRYLEHESLGNGWLTKIEDIPHGCECEWDKNVCEWKEYPMLKFVML